MIFAYVDALQDAYLQLRRRWRPDFKRVPRGMEEAWRNVATELCRSNSDPYEYMNYVFDAMTIRHDDVYPRMALSPRLLASFIETKPDREEQLKVLVRLQAATLKQRVDNGENMRVLLMDPDIELSAVFRAAAANAYAHHDLLENFREDALRMIVFKPMYKKILGNWLPKDLLDG